MKTTFSFQLLKAVFLGAGLILVGASISYGSITFGWDAGTSSETASSTSGSDPNIAAGDVSRVNGGTSALENNSSASDYGGASANYNFEAHAAAGATVNTGSSTYFSIILTPDAGYTITLDELSLGSRSTTTGPASIGIYSSIDGFAASIGSESVLTDGNWSAPSAISLSGTGAAGTPVELRIYGYNGSSGGSSVNWRIDDISLSVTENYITTAVPEPAGYGLISAFVLLGICAVSTWRKNSAVKRA